MSARSLNKVILIGNLTRDVELRYTPSGTAVATFTVATNRDWVDAGGQKQESTEFTRCVAWSKLAEICSQILRKGRKVYVEGRMQTRNWTGQDSQEKQTTEVVVNEMIALDSKGSGEDFGPPMNEAGEMPGEEEVFDINEMSENESGGEGNKAKSKKVVSKPKKGAKSEAEEVADDIPF